MTFFKRKNSKTKIRRRISPVMFYILWTLGHVAVVYAYGYSLGTLYGFAEYFAAIKGFSLGKLACYLCIFALPMGIVFFSAVYEKQLIQAYLGQQIRGWYSGTIKSLLICLLMVYAPPVFLGYSYGWGVVRLIFWFGMYFPAMIVAVLHHEKVLQHVLDVRYWHRIRYYTAWSILGLGIYIFAPEDFYVLGFILPMVLYSAGQALLMLWTLHHSLRRGYYFPSK